MKLIDAIRENEQTCKDMDYDAANRGGTMICYDHNRDTADAEVSHGLCPECTALDILRLEGRAPDGGSE